jgi:hypothetical protein
VDWQSGSAKVTGVGRQMIEVLSDGKEGVAESWSKESR